MTVAAEEEEREELVPVLVLIYHASAPFTVATKDEQPRFNRTPYNGYTQLKVYKIFVLAEARFSPYEIPALHSEPLVLSVC